MSEEKVVRIGFLLTLIGLFILTLLGFVAAYNGNVDAQRFIGGVLFWGAIILAGLSAYMWLMNVR